MERAVDATPQRNGVSVRLPDLLKRFGETWLLRLATLWVPPSGLHVAPEPARLCLWRPH
jgi:hypothetical protein